MKVAATTGAGGVQVQLDLGLEAAAPKSAAPPEPAAAPMEREAKRRRVHAVPGPPAGAGGGGAGRRGRRRRVQAATAVQRLFQACRHVFRGPGTVPKPAEVQLLRDMLGTCVRHPAPPSLPLSSSLHSSLLCRCCKSLQLQLNLVRRLAVSLTSRLVLLLLATSSLGQKGSATSSALVHDRFNQKLKHFLTDE